MHQSVAKGSNEDLAMTKADKRIHRGREETAAKYAAKRQSHPVIRTDAAAAMAHQKQATKGLQQFRARQEIKRLQTAKQLRSYQRACKREGYEPGSGASRKRQNAPTTTTTTSTDTAVVVESGAGLTVPSHDNTDKTEIDSPTISEEEKDVSRSSTAVAVSRAHFKSEHHSKKHSKAKNPQHMGHTLDKRQLERQHQAQERERVLQQRDQQRQEALQRRRQRHKLLTARTARGQPVMKNLVHDILNQLQQQQAKETKRAAPP
jgi:rRNA processing